MKKLFTFCFLGLVCMVQAQTATNFIANDCSGNPHNLFYELDSGKVIILVWVMPCGGCVGAAQTAANIAEDYAATDSGRVYCYIADDYGDASCLTINSWVNNNNIARVTTFSDSVIDMSAYGPDGMPKVVVLGGGTSHTVYFNEDNQFADDSLGIKIGVDSALADANSTGDQIQETVITSLYPNPSLGDVQLYYRSPVNETITIDIVNISGQVVRTVQQPVSYGANTFPLDLTGLAGGEYLIRIVSSKGTEVLPLNIASQKQ